MTLNKETFPIIENRPIFENQPPFSELLRMARLEFEIEPLISSSHRFDPAYLSWLTVRRAGISLNSETNNAGLKISYKTGFEGYFVGRVNSSTEMTEKMIGLGLSIWDSIKKLYPYSPQTRNQLEKMILGEKFSLKAAFEWSNIFGATIATQKATLLNNKPGQLFRDQNRQSVRSLPNIIYIHENPEELSQKYELPINCNQEASIIQAGNLSDEILRALTTMQEIGKFGHPLFRSVLHTLSKGNLGY